VTSPNHTSSIQNKELDLYVLCQDLRHFAASLAAKSIEMIIQESKHIIDSYNNDPSPLGRLEIDELLRAAIGKTNSIIYDHFQNSEKQSQPVLSIDVCLIVCDYIFVAHVGTNRAILVRHGSAENIVNRSLRTDDSLELGFVIDHTDFKIQDASSCFLGSIPEISVTVQPVPILSGDTILLLTHDAYEEIGLKQGKIRNSLLEILNQDDIQKVTKNILKKQKIPSAFSEAVEQSEPISMSEKVVKSNNATGSLNIDVLVLRINKTSNKLDKRDSESLTREFDILKNISLCLKLQNDPQNLNRIYSISSRKKFNSGHVLMSRGDPSDEMYIILSGSVDGYQNEEFIYKVEAGAITGEIGVFNNEPRTFTVIAAEETEVLIIKKEQLFSLMKNDVQLSLKIYMGLVYEYSNKIKKSLTDKARLKNQPIEQKR
jgi:CRP-like cAMP-binding protein/serine/threonine protein phosphatase PrpC